MALLPADLPADPARTGEPRRLGLWLLLALSPFALAPGLAPGATQTQAGFVPAWNVAAPATLANVATQADFWRGTGAGALLPAQPLLLLGVAPLQAVEWVRLSCLLLGALAVYIWLRPSLDDRAAGLAGLVYLFLPATLGSVYVRGGLDEALLLALLPLALAGLSAYAGERSPLAAAVAIVSLLWLLHAQAGAALCALLLLALYSLWVEQSPTALLIVLVSGAAGLVSLYPLWGTVAAPPLDFKAQLGTLGGLLRGIPSASAPGMLALGVGAFVLGAITFWLLAGGPARAHPARRLLLFALAASALLLALTLGWSAPLWQLTRADALLAAPWLLGLLAAPFLAAAAGGAVALLPALGRPTSYAALAGVLLLAATPWLTPPALPEGLAAGARPVALMGQQQIAVVQATVTEQADPRTATLTLAWQVLRPLEVDANLFLHALSAAEPAQGITQLDLPPVADRPAMTWQPGEIFVQSYTLELPAATAGALVYHVGLYDWQSGERLPVNGGLDNKLVLYGSR